MTGFAYDFGSRHAGHGGFVTVVMNGLRVFTKRHFHGNREFYHRFIHHAACGFQGSHHAADRIGAAGTGDDSRHAGAAGFLKAAVKAVDRVDRPERSGCGHTHLVSVFALKSHAVLPHSEMRMRVDESGIYSLALQIYNRVAVARFKFFHAADSGNPAAADGQITVCNSLSLSRVNICVDKNQDKTLSPIQE